MLIFELGRERHHFYNEIDFAKEQMSHGLIRGSDMVSGYLRAIETFLLVRLASKVSLVTHSTLTFVDRVKSPRKGLAESSVVP